MTELKMMNAIPADDFSHDVFPSHSAKDKAVVGAVSLSSSIPFSASDWEEVGEGRMRCSRESGERAGVRCRSLRLLRA
jgi:hypothetical protein